VKRYGSTSKVRFFARTTGTGNGGRGPTGGDGEVRGARGRAVGDAVPGGRAAGSAVVEEAAGAGDTAVDDGASEGGGRAAEAEAGTPELAGAGAMPTWSTHAPTAPAPSSAIEAKTATRARLAC
jgi:hypothetical protein